MLKTLRTSSQSPSSIVRTSKGRAIMLGPSFALAALASSLVLSSMAGAQAVETDEIVPLSDWRYDDLYGAGVSAEEFIDEMDGLSVAGEEIGEVEDLLIGPDGRIVAIVAEIGVAWGLDDTHVSVPFEEVDATRFDTGIVVPIAEETIAEYDLYGPHVLDPEEVGSEVAIGVEDALAGGRLTRVTDFIGDRARLLQDEEGAREYGTVSDVILSEGEIAAVVVEPDAAFGAGTRAYPYYGHTPGGATHDLPYGEAEVAELGEFDAERFEVE